MRRWGRFSIAFAAISTAAAVILLVLGIFSLFFVCRRRKTPAMRSTESLADPPQMSPSPAAEKLSAEDVDDGELSCLRRGLRGSQRTLFAIQEEEDETTETEDGRTRGGRKSSRRSYAGSQDSGGMSPSTGTTPFLTPLSGSPFSTPPSTPSHNHAFGIP